MLAIVFLWGSHGMTYGKTAKGVNDAKNGEINLKKVDESTADYQLSAQAEKTRVHAGEPVVLQITIKNNSKREISYGAQSLERLFTIEVKNKKGETMPLTRYGKSLFVTQPGPPPPFSGLGGDSLKPGEAKTYRFLINRMYDMTVPDIYAIVAKRSFTDVKDGETIEVVSNQVKVEVGGFDASMPANPAPEDNKQGR
jgi:hypothetical protein